MRGGHYNNPLVICIISWYSYSWLCLSKMKCATWPREVALSPRQVVPGHLPGAVNARCSHAPYRPWNKPRGRGMRWVRSNSLKDAFIPPALQTFCFMLLVCDNGASGVYILYLHTWAYFGQIMYYVYYNYIVWPHHMATVHTLFVIHYFFYNDNYWGILKHMLEWIDGWVNTEMDKNA